MPVLPPVQIAVLVVDDEALVRMYAVDMLEDAGFMVIEAADAEEALEQLARNPCVSVLFTDINMPGAFDGLELARRVHLFRPDVQLILTSGRARPGHMAGAPFTDFLAKPYGPNAIAGLIRSVEGE